MAPTLTLLGTGTPAPLTHRAGSSYLVELAGEKLLFDCGPGSVRRLLERGVSPAEVSGLFLTHLHYDHCVDYAYLNLVRWDQGVGKIPELEVWGPRPLGRMTESLLGAEGAFGPDLAARTEHPGSHFIYEMRGGQMPREWPAPVVTEVAHGDVVARRGWQVRVAEVVHVQPQLECLAYRFEAESRSIVFGGDTAPVAALTELAQGADVLLHMCHFVNGVVTDPRLTECCSGHLDAARTAQEAGVGMLVLVHITESEEQPGVKEQVIREAGEIFAGPVIFAEDLLQVPLAGIAIERIR
jgi:ribonuclease BN (tRNA processing enzyme)